MSWLVIDESDKLLEDSVNSFSDQFRAIHEKCRKHRPEMRVAMFSATQTKPVLDWVNENLCEDVVFVRVGSKDAAVETVVQELRYCYSEETKLGELRALLAAGRLQVPCLIFLDQASSARYLHELIAEHGRARGVAVALISGQCGDAARSEAVAQFREGRVHFMLCTNLLARGIDFKAVATVVNYDLPKRKEEYIHRVGRCGRAGHAGRAISFWTDADAAHGLPGVLAVMRASGQPINEELCALVRQRQLQTRRRRDKGDELLARIKRRYQGDGDDKDEKEDGDKEQGEAVAATAGGARRMKAGDKRVKLFVENCVVRKKFLKMKAQGLAADNE